MFGDPDADGTPGQGGSVTSAHKASPPSTHRVWLRDRASRRWPTMPALCPTCGGETKKEVHPWALHRGHSARLRPRRRHLSSCRIRMDVVAAGHCLHGAPVDSQRLACSPEDYRDARPRPTPRPPHSRSARLSPSLDAAPDSPVPPAPHPHPSARFLTASLLMAQDGSGSKGDRGGDARLRPGVAAGSRGGRPHFAHPVARRGRQGSSGCPTYAPPTRARSSSQG